MKAAKNSNLSVKSVYPSASGQAILIVISLAALLGTFLLTFTSFRFEIKIGSFAAIVVVYLVLCVSFYVKQRSGPELSLSSDEGSIFNSDVESRLFALEEANKFFGTSLKPVDMFRLVASRVNELIPYGSCVFLLRDDKSGDLKLAHVEGANSFGLKDPRIEFQKGLAGKALISRRPQLDDSLVVERSALPGAAIGESRSAISVPLLRGLDVFGVIQLYSSADRAYDENSLTILEAVGERVAPLFLSSIAFEKTLSNALTDSLTNLPNERAFYMLLENQIAESQRYRDERPLTVLAIDIKNFNELNQEFGHAAGDRILAFSSDVVKGQLRKMDSLSRSSGDEFLAVLPTASEKIGLDIIARIENVLASTPFEISDRQYTNLEFNFGLATFWKDGETAPALLQHALLRKQQTKSIDPKKVLWFPREYVN